jgi:hypothetical protein
MLNIDNIRDIAKYCHCADIMSLLLISKSLSIFISHTSLLQYLSECYGLPYTKTFVQLLRFTHLPKTRLAKLALKTNDFRLYDHHCNQLSDKIKSAQTTLKYGNIDLFKHICTQNEIPFSSVKIIEAAVEFNQYFLLKEILSQNSVVVERGLYNNVKTFQMCKLLMKEMSVDFNEIQAILYHLKSKNQVDLIVKSWMDVKPIGELDDEEMFFLFNVCCDSTLVEIITSLISKEFIFVPKYFYWATVLSQPCTLQIMLTCKNFQNLAFQLGDQYMYYNGSNFYRDCACKTYTYLVQNGYISVENIIDQYHGTSGQYICDYIQSSFKNILK